MHILHSILVHLPGNVPANEGESREEYLKRIRLYAEEKTDGFYESAYNGRETATAGGWADEYPENVILGSENGEKLVQELKKNQKSQAQEIKYNMDALINCFGDQLSGIVSWIQKGSVGGTPIQGSYYAFLLKNLAKLLDGEYFYDSCFYDTTKYTARVDEATIENVQEKPQDWAMALFDYHF